MTPLSEGLEPLRLPAPHPVQLRGSLWAARVLRSLGWRLHFEGLPARQGVAVVYPHTSNWDFPIMVLAKWAIGIDVRFWGKDTLFEIPLFGRWLRWLGGIPVERKHPQGSVGQMVARIRAAKQSDEFMWLALAPEGTRSWSAGWRSGFYRVACETQVPLALVSLDFTRKHIRLMDFLQLSGHEEADYAAMAESLGSVQGLKAHQAAPIRPLPHKDC